jgi:hypothetical protein
MTANLCHVCVTSGEIDRSYHVRTADCDRCHLCSEHCLCGPDELPKLDIGDTVFVLAIATIVLGVVTVVFEGWGR